MRTCCCIVFLIGHCVIIVFIQGLTLVSCHKTNIVHRNIAEMITPGLGYKNYLKIFFQFFNAKMGFIPGVVLISISLKFN